MLYDSCCEAPKHFKGCRHLRSGISTTSTSSRSLLSSFSWSTICKLNIPCGYEPSNCIAPEIDRVLRIRKDAHIDRKRYRTYRNNELQRLYNGT
ncbi:hypothetical protein TKK_0011435 [Trichogramma kaykai]